MQIAESVHIENVRETGGQTHVLEETREQMPRITLKEV